MRNIFKATMLAMVIAVLVLRPALSYADWHGHGGHGHDDGGHGHFSGHDHGGFHGHSYIGVDFSLWPDTGYYGALYYPPMDDVLVSPPVYQPVVINEAQPQTIVVDQAQASGPVITSVESTGDTIDTITINIPNKKGGYTAVSLKKSGNGYIGPQGEFYPEFPKVSQLVVIYGK